MKVLILGAGVIGVTTAWYLACAGHDVTVIDRQSGPAQETSFANAGEISPGYAAPWAAPGVPFKAVKWLFQRHAPLILHPRLDPAQWAWMWQMLTQCTPRAYARNKSRMVRVAQYSLHCLQSLRAETGICYDGRTQGTLQVFRTPHQVEAAAKDIKVLRQGGVRFEVLDPAGCIAAEPGLAHARAPIAGGLRLPDDETGDCYLFTTRLTERAAAVGVQFLWDTTAKAILTQGDQVTGIQTGQGPIMADRVVMAMGSYSPALLAPHRIRIPVYPLKGYSLTLPIVDAGRAPVSTVMDETYKIAITRLGDRIRVGGLAEIAGDDLSLSDRRRATLALSVGEMFPGAGDDRRASFWTGLRPMTPDGTPIIGPTTLRGLYLNTGHGTLGWTMAAGSGRIIADMISGKTPEIDTSDLGPSRYAA